MPTAETPVLDDSLANLVEKVSQRLLVLTDGEHRAYVGSELPAVDRALSRIQNEGLVPGPVFCEWGSGLGESMGVVAINGFRPHGIEIQRELVASARSLASDLNYAMVFAEGVFNGDVGYVRRIDPDAQELVIEFDDRRVAYHFGELDAVALAYAVSIRRSQGSDYPAVVIPMMMQHYMVLRRNLLYTGITRGRKLVVLVGQKQAIGMAARGKIETRRWSKLVEWMA